MNLIRTAIFWIVMVFGTLIVSAILFPTVTLVSLLGMRNPDRLGHFFATIWGKLFFYCIPGWSVKVEGIENLPPPDEPVVYISNHQSASDIMVMYYLGRQFRWLSKKEVFKVPVVGTAMRLSGYIPINRGDRKSSVKAMTEARLVLQRGFSMFFFPEGTRSQTQELRTFKSGAFRLAEEADVRVVPLTLHGTGDMIQKGAGSVNKATAHITIHRPEQRQADESLEKFAARTREIISSELNRLRSTAGC